MTKQVQEESESNSIKIIKKDVEMYYSEKINLYGPTHRGVDWNSKESQELRFAQLMKLCDEKMGFTINDLGCGFGSLLYYLISNGYDAVYNGYDLAPRMIEEARKLYCTHKNSQFILGDELLTADYTVASGIFNVKIKHTENSWEKYINEVLDKMNAASTLGFSFNILTSYSDEEYRRQDLYYGNPLQFFDYCKKRYSRNVALLHDYNLYEFTIIVRK